MKIREVCKYPYNVRLEDEIKIFLSDTICEEIVKIHLKNGQLFFTIKGQVTSKNKEILLTSAIILAILFGKPSESKAIGIPLRVSSVPEINRPVTQHSYQYAPTVIPKLDKVTFSNYTQLPTFLYLIDDKFIKTPQIHKLITKLRGGSSLELATALIIIIVIWQIAGVGFGGAFQLPIVHPNGGIHRPPNGGVQQQINHPKHGGKIRVWMSQSGQCRADQMQISSFVKNGKVDLQQCYDEAVRRARSMDCSNWNCDFKRFQSLATENGQVTETSAREAITVLNGEMLGFYENAERVFYGKGVTGPDFKVTGKGVYSHVTHVEIKNPVGSIIEKASCNGYSDLVKQGNKIGDKLSKQQIKWSNENFRKSLSNIDLNAPFPQDPANVLGLVDEFDVPISEKSIVQNAIQTNCVNASSVIFINNQTNI